MQIKCFENEELHVNVTLLEQQLSSLFDDKLSSFAHETSKEHADELRKKKILSQEIESNVQLSEENSGLCFENQKPTEEASYAKELTSVDVVEFKNLVGKLTKLSMQNAKLKKELLVARIFVNQTINGINSKYCDNTRHWKKGRWSGHSYDFSRVACDGFEL
ncbi:hypothetical protein PVK06_047264 [Gossypium arboreum]|uniref:Uncharacterized protein n=1 Tax=Gossypium arboreum TaxID=29729 RepID=A0ABR0MCX0_GOSAR|nr:hypothetical protein PVK06_047264 [Gossypium arboreum]